MSADLDFGALLDERLSDVCTPDVIEGAEREWPGSLWNALDRDGFTSIGLAEENEGSGGDIADACAVLRAVGRNSAPGPWAEAGLLAGYLTHDLPGVLPSGMTTVAPAVVQGRATQSGGFEIESAVKGVPWARAADHILLVVRDDRDHSGLVVLPRSAVDVEEGDNAAGEAQDTVRVRDVVAPEVLPLDAVRAQNLAVVGAFSRAALIAGAMARIGDLTVTYSQQRHQFGRPIGAFQLVQRHLVTLAEQAALVNGAVDAATAAVLAGRGVPEMMAAKIIANTAASEGAKAAHQAHGAIGVTREYRLHQFTRRLWSWRSEYGASGVWAAWLGERVVAAGADAFYPTITELSQLTA